VIAHIKAGQTPGFFHGKIITMPLDLNRTSGPINLRII
jgi:hypothetical protein